MINPKQQPVSRPIRSTKGPFLLWAALIGIKKKEGLQPNAVLAGIPLVWMWKRKGSVSLNCVQWTPAGFTAWPSFNWLPFCDFTAFQIHAAVHLTECTKKQFDIKNAVAHLVAHFFLLCCFKKRDTNHLSIYLLCSEDYRRLTNLCNQFFLTSSICHILQPQLHQPVPVSTHPCIPLRWPPPLVERSTSASLEIVIVMCTRELSWELLLWPPALPTSLRSTDATDITTIDPGIPAFSRDCVCSLHH